MQVIDNDKVVFYDVDDTLVKWPENWNLPGSFSQPSEGSLPFVDPYDSSINHLIPFEKHINLLKKHKGRGYLVIVWSAGGVRWAQSVINTLELQGYVDFVMTKPLKYVDDLTAGEILGERIYLK